MSRRFHPMPPRPPRKPAHRKPNGPGAGVTFKEIVLKQNSMPIPDRLLRKDSRVPERFEFPIESLVMESYYDGVESPHGFDYYASGGEKDAIAGTLDIGLSHSDLLHVLCQDGCYFEVAAPIESFTDFEGISERLLTTDTRALIEVFQSYIESSDLELTLVDSNVGEGVYSAGWGRSTLSAGGGPEVPVTYEVTGSIRFNIPTEVLVAEVEHNPNLDEGRFLDSLRELAEVLKADGDESCVIDVMELHGEVYERDSHAISASEETATLYATLDATIYGVFNDDYGTSPILSESDAEDNYEEQVASGDYEYVKLCLVDRDGDVYETLKGWHKDDADRAPNPRRPGLPGRRRR